MCRRSPRAIPGSRRMPGGASLRPQARPRRSSTGSPTSLPRDQAGLLTHDRELLFEAVKKIIDLIGRYEKGAHENDWADVVLKLLLERDAIIEIDDLGSSPGRTRGVGGECRHSLRQRSNDGSDRSSVNKIPARERHGDSSSV